ncbi:type III-I CRISPR-associated gRAMP effector Cas7-11i [Desulfonatronum thioautotrophicum]|uniref:type III-I CRISPR-associated gRAMP effector Cas7-11i n=1 Tax=Desulfonatronum thioautotrophicum TaxID=617001 RepID=UPI0005EB0F2E|nr:RAMP superfamily CRISPR-associated protein [Desulfonatronum thioautotrophicum]
MIISGKIHAESPIYRGNARKTLFTRDGDGIQRLVSLPGKIEGTAQTLMDAFTGKSNNGRNIGLLERLWIRLFGDHMPNGLITDVACTLSKASYPSDHIFDLRMGMTLDEDRWASIAQKNYKMETVLRDSVFDFSMTVSDSLIKKPEIQACLYYLLNEMTQGRFWFGAGKSKGLGRIRLELDKNLPTPEITPTVNPKSNHLRISMRFDSMNPILVGWNWGKIEQEGSPTAPITGNDLIAELNLPSAITQKLQRILSGPIMPDQWKAQLKQFLPKTIAIWLREQSKTDIESWTLPSGELAKLGKGKFALSGKLMDALNPLTAQTFTTKEEAESAIMQAMAKKQNMADRVIKILKHDISTGNNLNQNTLQEFSKYFDIDETISDFLVNNISDEDKLISTINGLCIPILEEFNIKIDRYVKMQQSDDWVDKEIYDRQQHMKIKEMIRDGKIDQYQWDNINNPPKGILENDWREFLDAHPRVQFRHMTNQRNLEKSIQNDRNNINFLQSFRDKTRHELTKPEHIDFRAGGHRRSIVSQKYGKPYDSIFMRMLVMKPGQKIGSWEAYIPGSTIKGAFRKRASQVLKTLWGEGRQTDEILGLLFGIQGQKAIIHFSDAYLAFPDEASRYWCSVDGIKLNSQTGQPVESAKFDYLYAYGPNLVFRMQLDLMDVNEGHEQALSFLAFLINDFKNGDVPLGGFKNSGMGWVEANIEEIQWLTGNPADIGRKIFSNHSMQQSGLWNQLVLQGSQADHAFQPTQPILSTNSTGPRPLQNKEGYISHRSFGGYSGRLVIEAKVLTPLHIRESGEPSFSQQTASGAIYGWDFFSMAPAQITNRPEQKAYALPAKSLRGMLRHVYAVASDSREPSKIINNLNPVDRLFGWVGTGTNQALMGRISVGFGHFNAPSLNWYKVPFPYGEWQFGTSEWTQHDQAKAKVNLIDNQWRLFPNLPPAPLIEPLDDFTPDTVQATYLRAMSPGTTAKFTIRFWNLEEIEFRRLLWCIQLDADMTHKIGKSKYLGFGSLHLQIQPESFLIDWNARYSTEDTGRVPLDLAQLKRTDQDVYHYAALRRALNADAI